MSDSDSSCDLQELLACPGLYKEIPEPVHHAYNKTALINTLNQIKNNLPWIERLDIVTTPAPAPKDLDVTDNPDEIDPDDDFKRENYFYRTAQSAILKAIPQLHEIGISTKRPEDYFAEMVKSDDHMVKVKKHLIESQQRIALHERAKQIRERRKFGKQAQIAVLQARKQEKRKFTEAVKSIGKKSGIDRTEKLEQILNEFKREYEPSSQEKNPNKKHYFSAKDVANRRKINHKRDYKNKKYGHGGQKKRQKRNTLESLNLGIKKDSIKSRRNKSASKNRGPMKINKKSAKSTHNNKRFK